MRIPVFLRVPESYQSYLASTGRTDVGDAGRQLGLWYSICALLALIPCLGFFAGIAALVLLILLLVKITNLRKEIEASRGGMVPPAG